MERGGFDQWKPREVARLLSLLETDRRYYQEILSSLPVALAILSEDRTILSVNRAFRRRLGLTNAELRDKTIEQILPSEQLIEKIRLAHVAGGSEAVTVRVGPRAFRATPIAIRSWEDDAGAETLLVVEEAGGAPPAQPGAEPDLTAARLDAVRTQAGKLAHDLNNPLMIITGYAEEMQNSLPANDPRRAELAEILGAAARMSEITGKLVSFTRSEARAPQSVMLQDVVALAAGPVRSAAGGMAVEIREGGPVAVLAEREQLGDALVALALLALETSRRPSRISIACEGEAIRIEVEGEGSEDPAHRLESMVPATRAYLNIQEWGGNVTFSADRSRGSAVTVHLRRAGTLESRATILIVEDEQGIRALMRKILAREQYHVIEAGSAEEAMSAVALHRGQIHLLLTDITLPGMNGRDLAGKLREQHPQMKVVYVSGNAGRQGLPANARFLQKPFTLSALTDAVGEALS